MGSLFYTGLVNGFTAGLSRSKSGLSERRRGGGHVPVRRIGQTLLHITLFLRQIRIF